MQRPIWSHTDVTVLCHCRKESKEGCMIILYCYIIGCNWWYFHVDSLILFFTLAQKIQHKCKKKGRVTKQKVTNMQKANNFPFSCLKHTFLRRMQRTQLLPRISSELSWSLGEVRVYQRAQHLLFVNSKRSLCFPNVEELKRFALMVLGQKNIIHRRRRRRGCHEPTRRRRQWGFRVAFLVKKFKTICQSIAGNYDNGSRKNWSGFNERGYWFGRTLCGY